MKSPTWHWPARNDEIVGVEQIIGTKLNLKWGS